MDLRQGNRGKGIKSIAAVALAFCMIFTACGSKELSRSKAAKLIKQQYFTPQAIESSMWTAQLPEGKDQFCSNDGLGKGGTLRKYESLGWINLVIRRSTFMGCAVDISLTPEGQAESKGWKKAGLGSESGTWLIPIARKEFIEVTGFTSPASSMAVAEYTWNWVPTDNESCSV